MLLVGSFFEEFTEQGLAGCLLLLNDPQFAVQLVDLSVCILELGCNSLSRVFQVVHNHECQHLVLLVLLLQLLDFCFEVKDFNGTRHLFGLLR